jgi:hypothetical protein
MIPTASAARAPDVELRLHNFPQSFPRRLCRDDIDER